jgi:peptidoglycan/xylan/chitin deacetylase (PgdA/CDA1 family)
MDRRAFLRRAGLAAGGAVAGAGAGLGHEWVRVHDLENSGHAVGVRRPHGLTSTNLIYRLPAAGPRVALTFDDGPSTKYTARMLDVLERADARATFFQVGERVRALPDLARAVAQGHAVGNHTWSHPDLSLAEADDATRQLTRAHDQIAQTLGAPPMLFRPPYGRFSGATAMIATSLGASIVLWDTLFDVKASAAENVRRLSESAQDGTIILGHDGGPLHSDVVLDALPDLIRALHDRGFELVTVPEMMVAAGV